MLARVILDFGSARMRATTVAIGCPFCRIMLSDALTTAQADGRAEESVAVQDISQMLLEAVKRGKTPPALEEKPIDIDPVPDARAPENLPRQTDTDEP